MACVIAGRLAAASSSLKILVLESGPDTKDDAAHFQLGRFLSHYHPASKTVRFHMSPPTDAVNGRPIPVIAGQCLGGGSSVNCEYLSKFLCAYAPLSRYTPARVV